MKKFFTILLSLMTVFAFTGCDTAMVEDTNNVIADNLDGIWSGTVAQTFFVHRWGGRGLEEVTEYQDVDIEFYTNPFRYAKGKGVEYDYTYIDERTGRCEYVRCDFDFEVRGRNIYIHYYDGYDDFSDSYIAIYNFRLNGNIFDGEFHDYYTGEYLASFQLDRVDNWRYSRGDYYMEWTRGGNQQSKKPVEFVEVKAPFKK